MADLLRSDRDLAPSFLNSVLNQLNWAFSEFIGMIQEVRVPLWDLALDGCPCPTSSKVPDRARCAVPLADVGAELCWELWPSFWEGAAC